MIVVVVKNKVRGKFADEWPELVKEYTEATRAEPGNISFEWSRSADDDRTWVLVEVFEDAAAGDAHVQSEHFATASAQMGQWLAAVPELIHIEGTSIGWGPAGG